MILAILLTITPFIFPIAMSALGLLTGMVPSLHFLHSGHGLYRCRHAYAQDRPGSQSEPKSKPNRAQARSQSRGQATGMKQNATTKGRTMDSTTLIAIASTSRRPDIALEYRTGLGEGARATALSSLAQQPDVRPRFNTHPVRGLQ